MTGKSTIKGFIRAAQKECIRGYTEHEEEVKARWLRAGQAILAELATLLGYATDEYDVRINPGGPAVSGSVVFHSDRLYVDFSQTVLGADMGFMWRICRGRDDHEGMENRWMPWETLSALPRVAATMRHAVFSYPAGPGVLKRSDAS